MLAVGGVFLLAFGIAETRIAEPVLEPALLRNRAFSGVLLAAILLNFAAYVSFAYSSIWMQSVLHLSPVRSGLVSLPMGVAAFVVSALLGRALHSRPAGRVIGGGLLLIGLGDLLGFVLVHEWPSWPALLPGFLVAGLGVGFATPRMNATGMAAVPPERGGMAAGAVNSARQVGYAFGIALLGNVFTAGARHTLADRHVPAPDVVAHAVTAGRSASWLQTAGPDVIRAAAANGIAVLLAVAGVVGVVAAVLSARMIRER